MLTRNCEANCRAKGDWEEDRCSWAGEDSCRQREGWYEGRHFCDPMLLRLVYGSIHSLIEEQ